MNPNALYEKPRFSHHRLITNASGVSADATDITTLPERGAINCDGWKTVAGIVLLTGGTSPTVAIEQLEAVEYKDTSGVVQKKLVRRDVITDPLSNQEMFELEVNSGRLYCRIHSVTGTPTQVEIMLTGSEPLLGDV